MAGVADEKFRLPQQTHMAPLPRSRPSKQDKDLNSRPLPPLPSGGSVSPITSPDNGDRPRHSDSCSDSHLVTPANPLPTWTGEVALLSGTDTERDKSTPTRNFFSPTYLDPQGPSPPSSPVVLMASAPRSTRPEHFSLPDTASIASSLPSCSTPSSVLYDPDPMSRLDQTGKDERASIALSIMSSSDSDHHDSLNEATVQMAYLECLRMSKVSKRGSREGAGSVTDEDRSAILALDEAASRIADVERHRVEDGVFDHAECYRSNCEACETRGMTRSVKGVRRPT